MRFMSYCVAVLQDAAEAFLHLLSSLKEEISDYNHLHQCSLVDVFASNGRIITSRSKGDNELERWQSHFLGPFDGVLGSILTCQSCTSQVCSNFITINFRLWQVIVFVIMLYLHSRNYCLTPLALNLQVMKFYICHWNCNTIKLGNSTHGEFCHYFLCFQFSSSLYIFYSVISFICSLTGCFSFCRSP